MTGVGAILLRFSRPCSSDSELVLATLSRFMPVLVPKPLLLLPLSCEWPGVCGGVKRGMEELGFDDPAAARDGTALMDGVGLFMTGGAF